MSFIDRRHFVRNIILLIPIAIVIVTVWVIFRHFNPNVEFTYYEPTYLPPHTSIKEKRIYLIKNAAPVMEQNFRTEDWVYSIQEWKGPGTIGTADQKYDEKSVKPTCSILQTNQHIRYRLCHWIDYGRIDVHEVKFVKNNTNVRAMIPTKTSETISVAEISKFVDSFEKRSTTGIPVLRSIGP